MFSYEALDNAALAYSKLVSRIAALRQDGEVDMTAYEKMKKAFTDALDNDLNTSLAVTAVFDALRADTNDATKLYAVADFDSVLSLGLIEAAKRVSEAPADSEGDSEIELLVSRRAEAKKAKDYALADEIRNQLAEMGIVLEDTPSGTKWKRA